MDRFSNYADYKDLLLRISEIEEALVPLPAGSIGKKTVNGKIYYYHRFYENGKRKEKYNAESDSSHFSTSPENPDPFVPQ